MFSSKRFFFIGLALLLALNACSAPALLTPTPERTEPRAVLTAAYQTAEARLTQSALLVPTDTPVPPTATPELTQTAAAQTQSALQTLAATLTPPGTPNTPTPTDTPNVPVGADNAIFTLVETIPDGTDFPPSTAFTKTWQFKNTGTSTWSTGYELRYISGEKMGGPDSVALPHAVAPNETVDISVNLISPAVPGSFTGSWRLYNPFANRFFGDSVYVLIDVVGSGGPPPITTVPPGSGATVTGASLAVDTAAYNGACPHTFTFTPQFTLNAASTVYYRFEAGGFTLTLPEAQSGEFAAGLVTLPPLQLEIGASGSGWVQLHITAPNDILSNQAVFTVTCQP